MVESDKYNATFVDRRAAENTGAFRFLQLPQMQQAKRSGPVVLVAGNAPIV